MLAFYHIPYGRFAPSVVAAAIFDTVLPAEAKLPQQPTPLSLFLFRMLPKVLEIRKCMQCMPNVSGPSS